VTNIFHVNPYPTPNTFVIEAEDFDYNGGSANPRAGIAGFDVNTMPYSAGAYSNLDAVLNVDYYNDDAQDSQVYRTNLLAHAGHNVDITGNLGGRWGADRGTYTLTNNFRIGWVNGGDWCDYTRTFPANTYQVWAALSNGDAPGTPHDMRGRLALVTAGVGTTNQTLQPLGIFDAPASGAWGDNELVPLTDTNGVWQTVQMTGKQTVRFNMDSGDFDYFLFVPALPGVQPPMFAPPVFVSAGSLRLQWTGSGTLQETGSLSPPNWVAAQSQANPQNVPTTTGSKYYRIFAP